ncbi:MAG: hypothetical protein S4CHLAM81_09690 [Chlamydiales bacterium]|nr:hypothetical protein [Chlamydiales bacterium]
MNPLEIEAASLHQNPLHTKRPVKLIFLVGDESPYLQTEVEHKAASLDSKAASLDSKAASLDSKAAPLDSKAAPLDSKAASLDGKAASPEQEVLIGQQKGAVPTSLPMH